MSCKSLEYNYLYVSHILRKRTVSRYNYMVVFFEKGREKIQIMIAHTKSRLEFVYFISKVSFHFFRGVESFQRGMSMFVCMDL